MNISSNYSKNDFLFYDIEVFKNDALVVFMNDKAEVVAEYHLCPENKDDHPFAGIAKLIEGKVLVGFNNYHYDDIILTLMMGNEPDNKTIKDANDCIISRTSNYIKVSNKINSLDAFQQIDVSRPSLKRIEANLGLSIEETPIAFDRDEPLSPEELEMVFGYCRHDVKCTVDVFKLRWQSYFIPKLEIVKLLPEYIRDKAIRWNTTTITQMVLTGKTDNSRIMPDVPVGGYIDFSEYPFLPSEVVKMWQDEEKAVKKVVVEDSGVKFEFGYGGMHGVPINNANKSYKDVKLLDVASLYPNLLIQFNGLGASTEKYKGIVKERLRIKHTDPVKSNALKLIINSTYGLLRPDYSKIYNPEVADAICFKGQIILFDLCQRLYEEGCNIINVNTDGVAFTGKEESYEKIWHQWEQDYGLTLELSEFKRWYQRDVNCYVAVYNNGEIKTKGGDIKKYNDAIEFTDNGLQVSGSGWCTNNSIGIVAKAVVEYLVNDKDIYDTVVENLNNPVLFQFIMQAGNTFLGNIDKDGNTNYQRINRGFAVKEKYADPSIYKYKIEKDSEGKEKLLTIKYANTPEHVMLINGDLRDVNLNDFASKIDIDHYASLAKKAMESFIY